MEIIILVFLIIFPYYRKKFINTINDNYFTFNFSFNYEFLILILVSVRCFRSLFGPVFCDGQSIPGFRGNQMVIFAL